MPKAPKRRSLSSMIGAIPKAPMPKKPRPPRVSRPHPPVIARPPRPVAPRLSPARAPALVRRPSLSGRLGKFPGH